MPEEMSRRGFLAAAKSTALGAVVAAGSLRCNRPASVWPAPAGSASDNGAPLKKALLYGILPGSMPVADRFALAADLGFEGVEAPACLAPDMIETMRSAADKAGVRIHSVMNVESWEYPLSSPDPAIVATGLEFLRGALQTAKALGADTVLQIPAVVKPDVRYRDAWKRSQRAIRRMLPLARRLGVVIAVENVGNRFLLSPLEFARYVDGFHDPYLRAYFDVGNSRFLWGYPQDWILTLGHRIRKIHLKDCSLSKRGFVLLRDGDVDWPAVHEALTRVGYRGFLTVEPNYGCPELERGDRKYLEKISKRVDLILQGK